MRIGSGATTRRYTRGMANANHAQDDAPSDEPSGERQPPDAAAPSAVPTLSYASTHIAAEQNENLVTVARCGNAQEAAIRVNALEAEGIRAITINEHAVANLGLYGANLGEIGVQVQKNDADLARQVLHAALSDEVEPADEQPQTMPSLRPDGEPLPLEVVGRFDTIRALREAALLLESARIRSVPPKLVPRQGPAGTGDRFHLRVAVDEVDTAREVLADRDEESEEGDLRCPKCGSWRIFPVGNIIPTIRWFLRMGDKPVAEMDCLECRHRAPREAFERKG